MKKKVFNQKRPYLVPDFKKWYLVPVFFGTYLLNVKFKKTLFRILNIKLMQILGGYEKDHSID